MARDEDWKNGLEELLQSVSVANDIRATVMTGIHAYRLGEYLFKIAKENMPEIKHKSSETIKAIREYCDRLAQKIITAYEKTLKTVQDTTKAAKEAVELILWGII